MLDFLNDLCSLRICVYKAEVPHHVLRVEPVAKRAAEAATAVAAEGAAPAAAPAAAPKAAPAEEAAPLPKAPKADPSASMHRTRSVYQASRSIVRN